MFGLNFLSSVSKTTTHRKPPYLIGALTVDYLVIAGGGAGSNRAGGGGAGGVRSTVGATGGGGTLESQLLVQAGTYSIQVGAGGTTNNSGTDSILSSITSVGGGAGGGLGSAGSSGGSGGTGGA